MTKMIPGNWRFIVPLATFFQLIISGLCDTVSLRTNLMESYDPKVPPRSSDNGPIKILMGLTLTHFLLEETEQVFQANVWFSMSWTDNRLAWNRTSSDNDTTILRFASHEIWQPDIILINNALPTETFHYGEFLLIVKPDGLVLMTIPAKLTSHCGMNMIRWPFDEHTCNLKVGSWTHSGSEVDLDLPSNIASNPNHAIDSNLYVPNSEWNLIKTFAEKDNEYYACCEEPYAVVKYSFTIQRSSPSYAATIILPIIVITLVNIMVFILPPTAGEKLSLASINFFIVCIYLIYFEARLPSIGDHLPLLVLLYSINAVLIGISIVISVIVINLSRNHGRASSPPQCFRMFCNASFAQVLGLGYIVPYVSMTHSRLNDDEGVEMQPPRENGRPSFDHSDKDHTTPLVTEMPYSANAEWILLAAMIDRLTLIIYTIVSGVTLGLCLA
ncbi:neuronal acetylcholine receptor subunit alpha-7 [Folsomia candida]|uniref:neuronal acetylcholine receptor subunit alpha-7 n=1 Tax=Folsomia candida TaxID=158441 RepID=UPI000B8FF2D7|nr:neuronal acetylcholine receptor subunit alpha-7 [Folsomia candida]